MSSADLSAPAGRRAPFAFTGGAVIGALGGLIGLGGAEFRLPLLIGAFHFAALQAVILNKAMSLVVVAVALPSRASAVAVAAPAGGWRCRPHPRRGRPARGWFRAGGATRAARGTGLTGQMRLSCWV